MMTAGEYRARADALDASADSCASYPLMLQLGACARDWRMLGQIADLQDTMLATLAATRVGPTS